MLDSCVDKGAFEFMGALIGYGVFVAQAGNNRLLLHQAANDGFRGIALICFDGPAASEGPIGFVMLCNGDNNGTRLLAEISKFILKNKAFGIFNNSITTGPIKCSTKRNVLWVCPYSPRLSKF